MEKKILGITLKDTRLNNWIKTWIHEDVASHKQDQTSGAENSGRLIMRKLLGQRGKKRTKTLELHGSIANLEG